MRKVKIVILAVFVGLLTPDIFLEPGMWCIERADDEKIGIEEVHKLLFDFHKGKTNQDIEYKSKILEFIRSML